MGVSSGHASRSRQCDRLLHPRLLGDAGGAIVHAGFRDPRVDWDVFATLCERLQEVCGGAEPLTQATRDLTERTLVAGGLNEAPRFTNSRQLYWLAQRWLVPALFHGVEAELVDLDDGRLELTVGLPSDARPCPQLFVLIEAALAAAPRVLGGDAAEVEVDVEQDGHRGRFRIRAPELTAETTRAQLEDSEQRYRAIAQTSRDMILEIDSSGRLVAITPNVREILGYTGDELVGAKRSDLIHPDDREALTERLGKLLQTGDSERLNFRVQHRDGHWRRIETTATAYRASDGNARGVLVSRDVTARSEVEENLRACREQLFHAQRTESIGRLAGGIAHDFNNLLTAIGGYGAVLREELGPDHPLLPDVDEITRSAEQAGELTRQLMNFGRRQEPRPEITDLNALVATVDRLLRRVMGEDVDLVASLDGDLGKVKVDRGQIEQLIVNLAMNARDAMPRGGRLVITTANAQIEADGEVAGVPAGTWVTLEVRDSGVGMDAETVSRIFEPFFSTKEQRRGTGLGLSTVAAIAQQCGGHVGVESAPGRGSTFTVYLPRVDEPEARREPSVSPTDLSGNETVLLVEDAKAVRNLLRRDLERHGYTVIDAPSANEALSRVERHEGTLDLLVTDVVLPGMDGPTLADQLRDEHPDLRVVYITGGSDENLAERSVSAREDVVLRKPLFAPALLCTLREVLESPPREPAEPPPEE